MIKDHKGILFKDREISWLAFNNRVLQEANDPTVPLLERIRFLSIFSSNQDEFFRVRVAGLQRLGKIRKRNINKIYFHPTEVLKEIQRIVLQQQEIFNGTWQRIIQELEQENIFMLNETQLTEEQTRQAKAYFRSEVASYLFPIILDTSTLHDFPPLRDKSIYLAVRMSYSQQPLLKPKFAIIEIPSAVLNRFVILSRNKDQAYLMMLDDVIRTSLPEIFSIFDYDKFEAYTIKVTRDAEMEIDNDFSESLLDKVKKGLNERKKGNPVRFIYDQAMPPALYNFLVTQLKLTDESIIPGGRYHNFKDFMSFPDLGKKHFQYEPLPPIPVKIFDQAKRMFEVISRQDVMLCHPYHSFDYLIRLLREAAIDPQVTAIKITLYRVATHSNVVNSLINAVKNGKKVFVVMELRARFDEESNIYWSDKLTEAGAKVQFGFPGKKVHCKMCLIYRKENGRTRTYSHLSTGNYNGKTARLYCDYALFTKSRKITSEMVKVFNLLADPTQIPHTKTLLVAPFNMRKRFEEMIEHEIHLARKGKNAYIIAKMNSLVDEEMVRKLYEAGQAGVKVQLIIRGPSSLVAGSRRLSENIKIISIIDRFLEHGRIYLFGNGGKEKMYLSSADWMGRNLDNRIETAFPIEDPKILRQLRQILKIQLKDNTKARIISPNDENHYQKAVGKEKIRAQYEIHDFLKEEAI